MSWGAPCDDYAVFNGANGQLATIAAVLDTDPDPGTGNDSEDSGYTVSAWADLKTASTTTDATIASQEGNGTSAFQLEYNHTAKSWALVLPSNDADAAGSNILTQLGTPGRTFSNWSLTCNSLFGAGFGVGGACRLDRGVGNLGVRRPERREQRARRRVGRRGPVLRILSRRRSTPSRTRGRVAPGGAVPAGRAAAGDRSAGDGGEARGGG